MISCLSHLHGMVAQDRMNHGRKDHASHPCLLRCRNKLLAHFSFVLKSSWGDVEDSFHTFQRFGYGCDVESSPTTMSVTPSFRTMG